MFSLLVDKKLYILVHQYIGISNMYDKEQVILVNTMSYSSKQHLFITGIPFSFNGTFKLYL